MKCVNCGQEKDSVTIRLDPYEWHVKDKWEEKPLCDECEAKLEEEI